MIQAVNITPEGADTDREPVRFTREAMRALARLCVAAAMREAEAADFRALFAWANQDSFWQSNVLLPQKLREHWDTLKLTKDRPNGKSNRSLVGAGQRHDPSAAERDPDH